MHSLVGSVREDVRPKCTTYFLEWMVERRTFCISAELCRLISRGGFSINNTCSGLIHAAPAYHLPNHSFVVQSSFHGSAYHPSICIPGGRGDRGRIKSRAGFCGRAADAKLVLMHNSGGRGGEEALSVLFPSKQTHLPPI